MPQQKQQQKQQRQQRQQTPVRVAPVRSLKAPTVSAAAETLSKLDYEISLLWGAIRFTCHKAPVLTGEEQ